MSRMTASTTTTTTSTYLRLGYFTAPTATTVANALIATGTTAAGATPTVVRIGLYTVAANGDLTLVASTPNDTTLLAATTTLYTKALSSSYLLVAGQRYALGWLIVTAAATPTVLGTFPASSSSALAALSPRLCGVVTGQTDLPASVLAASVTNTTTMPYLAVVP